MPLVVYLATVALYQPADVRLTVSRVVSKDYVRPDTEVTVTVTATNKGADLDEVFIADSVPTTLVVDGETSHLISLLAEQCTRSSTR